MALPLSGFSKEEATGFVCIAPVPKPNDRPIDLANPGGGNRSFNFVVQIDNQPKVVVGHEKSWLVADLALNDSHLVRIFRDGKPYASFRFRFSEYKEKKLCLWFRALYETWSLSNSSSAVGCKCDR